MPKMNGSEEKTLKKEISKDADPESDSKNVVSNISFWELTGHERVNGMASMQQQTKANAVNLSLMNLAQCVKELWLQQR